MNMSGTRSEELEESGRAARRSLRVTLAPGSRIEAIHGRVHASLQHILHHLDTAFDHVPKLSPLVGIRAAQHEGLHSLSVKWPANAELQAPKTGMAHVLDQRQNTAMPPSPSASGQPNATARQVKVVMDHQQVLGRNSEVAKKLPDGLATAVHVGQGLQESHPPARGLADPPARLELLFREGDRQSAGQALHHQEAGIVPGSFILLSGIAQPHNDNNRILSPSRGRLLRISMDLNGKDYFPRGASPSLALPSGAITVTTAWLGSPISSWSTCEERPAMVMVPPRSRDLTST